MGKTPKRTTENERKTPISEENAGCSGYRKPRKKNNTRTENFFSGVITITKFKKKLNYWGRTSASLLENALHHCKDAGKLCCNFGIVACDV